MKNSDTDGKLAVISKKEVKEAIGRSPDFADSLMLRAYFNVKDSGQGFISLLTGPGMADDEIQRQRRWERSFREEANFSKSILYTNNLQTMKTEDQIIEQRVQEELAKINKKPATKKTWIPRQENTLVPNEGGTLGNTWMMVPRHEFDDNHAEALIKHFEKLGKGRNNFNVANAIDTQMYRAENQGE